MLGFGNQLFIYRHKLYPPQPYHTKNNLPGAFQQQLYNCTLQITFKSNPNLCTAGIWIVNTNIYLYNRSTDTLSTLHLLRCNTIYFLRGNLKGESVVRPSCRHIRRWVFVPPDFFVAKPAKQFRLAWVAFPAWTWITQACRLLHGESSGNDNVCRSGWMIAPNPKVQ